MYLAIKAKTQKQTKPPLHHRFAVFIGDSGELPPHQIGRKQQKKRVSVVTGKAWNPSTPAVESPSPFLYSLLMWSVPPPLAAVSSSTPYVWTLRCALPLRPLRVWLHARRIER